jgi:hypothetical protein
MRTSISIESIVTSAKDQVSCDLSGEVVILNLGNGVYYGLNAIGARIWSWLEEPRSVEEIRTALVEEYDVDPKVCETQLLSLLNDLAANGLVDIVADCRT